jgi:hypothetical protein
MLIAARFNGPPGSGNGGWSAGVFAVAAGARVGGPPVEVTLRVPPPLDTPLTLDNPGPGADRAVVSAPDGTRVAEVSPVAQAGVAVPSVVLVQAQAAASSYAGFDAHPFPTCFVCGPDRAAGDGLRIFPGPLPDGRTAAPWSVPVDVGVETMWAALDCPGGWTVIGEGRVYLLGRIAVEVRALPTPGAECVVVGAVTASQGRKAHVGSTVYGPDGTELATARATWIAVG